MVSKDPEGNVETVKGVVLTPYSQRGTINMSCNYQSKKTGRDVGLAAS